MTLEQIRELERELDEFDKQAHELAIQIDARIAEIEEAYHELKLNKSVDKTTERITL